jgi:hypothetical protein
VTGERLMKYSRADSIDLIDTEDGRKMTAHLLSSVNIATTVLMTSPVTSG